MMVCNITLEGGIGVKRRIAFYLSF
jgi:hypothetical protein